MRIDELAANMPKNIAIRMEKMRLILHDLLDWLIITVFAHDCFFRYLYYYYHMVQADERGERVRFGEREERKCLQHLLTIHFPSKTIDQQNYYKVHYLCYTRWILYLIIYILKIFLIDCLFKVLKKFIRSADVMHYFLVHYKASSDCGADTSFSYSCFPIRIHEKTSHSLPFSANVIYISVSRSTI